MEVNQGPALTPKEQEIVKANLASLNRERLEKLAFQKRELERRAEAEERQAPKDRADQRRLAELEVTMKRLVVERQL